MNPEKPSRDYSRSESLVRSLRDPSAYDHAVDDIRVVETHISWIVLTGPFAYKIKKPVALGFLDFSTLARRRAMCEEELRLNRRLAPELYVDVVPITGRIDRPRINGAGGAVEYAVKMVQFDSGREMDVQAVRGMPLSVVDDLAREVADFHLHRAEPSGDRAYSTPADVRRRIEDNFVELRPHAETAALRCLDRLQAWVDARLNALEAAMERRRLGGFVRECHGDLHLGNMVLIGGRVRLFDCLEFNVQFRWIDVMSEVAFVMMDFDHHGHREYAWQFLNVYLSVTGDYRGLELLSLYLVYRAMVRAKVACIRHLQCHGQGHPMPDVDSHLALALRYAAEPRPRLFITHGFSGSGKSWWSERLARMLPAIHLRSDVERRREFTAAGAAPAKEDLYSAENIASIYARLLDLAGSILDSGKAVIVDATFLKHDQRERFLSMSQNRGVRALILDVECDEALMRRRIVKRLDHGNDPSEADTRVLDEQLRKAHPLSASERRSTVTIRSGEEKDTDAVLARISAIS